ncbi:DUF4393 domain-containing protein [soil metagenome]
MSDFLPRAVSTPVTPDDDLPRPPEEPGADSGRGDRVDLLTAGVGLARLTVGTSWRLGRWGLGASVRVGNRVVKAAVTGENATTLLDDATHALRDQARDLLGIVDDAGRIVGFQMSDPQTAQVRQLEAEAVTGKALRARGAALLDASADVAYDEPFHPAYSRILDELAPDEARIVRLLATEGSQPAVDVRTYSPFPGGSELIAPGLNMIGAEAGLHYVDRVNAYLNNLSRLGLIWFSREPVPDPMVYQVLEAQPDVIGALSKGRTKTVRRSIEITPFGQQFAEACIPLEQPRES